MEVGAGRWGKRSQQLQAFDMRRNVEFPGRAGRNGRSRQSHSTHYMLLYSVVGIGV
jgi:hypothetical protein